MNKLILGAAALISFIIWSCNSPYTFKKRGYYKIDFPEKKYTLFDQPGYPYSFEYPVYAHIIKDSTFFNNTPENPWWINIDFPEYRGRIHVSYKSIGKNNFDSLVADAYRMSYKQHTVKATDIRDSLFTTDNNVEGIYFTLVGNTASANQFFVTDTAKNFLRGALYFAATPNSDSLGVVNDFFKQDMLHLISTFKWK